MEYEGTVFPKSQQQKDSHQGAVEEEGEIVVGVGVEELCHAGDDKRHAGDSDIVAGEQIGEIAGGCFPVGGNLRCLFIDNGLDNAVAETYNEGADDEG